jgi:hypothetical protein
MPASSDYGAWRVCACAGGWRFLEKWFSGCFSCADQRETLAAKNTLS